MPSTPPSVASPTHHAPCSGVSYPLRIGKSVTSRAPAGRSSGARDLLSLKFTDVPDGAAVSQPGLLRRNGEKVSVELDYADVEASMSFAGMRKPMHDGATTADYMLVCVDGAFWLERVSDQFTAVRPVDVSKTRPSLDVNIPDHPDAETASRSTGLGSSDPDSWMPGVPDDDVDPHSSGSPITPDGVMDDTAPPVPQFGVPHHQTQNDGTQVSQSHGARTGVKTLSGLAASVASAPTIGRNDSVSHVIRTPSAAGKSVGGKTVSATTVPHRAARRQSGGNAECSDDDGSSSGSGSGSDDSDDSDSDSDSDSESDSDDEFTDRSSDEE